MPSLTEFLHLVNGTVEAVEEERCEVDRGNYKTQLAHYSKSTKLPTSLHFNFIGIDRMKTFTSTSGSSVKDFSINRPVQISSSDLVEILNSMPALEKLTINVISIKIEDREKVLDNSKRLKIGDKLKLPNLRNLIVYNPHESVYNFLTEFLPRNQIIEHEMCSLDVCERTIENTLYDPICKFFTKQKSIKKLRAIYNVTLRASKLLTLDDLDVSVCKNDVTIEALNAQKKLKTLHIFSQSQDNEGIYEEVCNLKTLEDLTVVQLKSDFNLIMKLKNLRQLCHFSAENFDIGGDLRWTSKKLESLETLVIPGGHLDAPEIFECFPNLRALNLHTSLKLETFAKFLPKLEVLDIWYEKVLPICELETGIVHQNLKVLHVMMRVGNFWKFAEISEIHEIFPNLEILAVEVRDDDKSLSDEIADQSFFKNFANFKKLKSLKLEKVPIRQFALEELAEDLKTLARVIDRIYFYDRLSKDEDWKNFSYKELVKGIKEKFDTFWWYDHKEEDSDDDLVPKEDADTCSVDYWNPVPSKFVQFALIIRKLEEKL